MRGDGAGGRGRRAGGGRLEAGREERGMRTRRRQEGKRAGGEHSLLCNERHVSYLSLSLTFDHEVKETPQSRPGHIPLLRADCWACRTDRGHIRRGDREGGG